MPGKVRIGISGWRYAPWRGTFYPKKLPAKNELAFASEHLRSIEINGSFYALQKPASYQLWYEQTPVNFVFSIKGPRYITHILRARNAQSALANFFASGVLALKEKLGPIFWQFPPNYKFDSDSLDAFFKLLPHDTEAAVTLARKHDDNVKGRVFLQTDGKRPLRHAIEIRNESFRSPEFIELLRRHRVALVVADTAGKWPLIEDVTADFIYIRLHGDEQIYVSGYTGAALQFWRDRILAWRNGREPQDSRKIIAKSALKRSGRDVFVYFDNDVKVRSPADAMQLAQLVDAADSQ